MPSRVEEYLAKVQLEQRMMQQANITQAGTAAEIAEEAHEPIAPLKRKAIDQIASDPSRFNGSLSRSVFHYPLTCCSTTLWTT